MCPCLGRYVKKIGIPKYPIIVSTLKYSAYRNKGVARIDCGSGELALDTSDGDGEATTLSCGALPNSIHGASRDGILIFVVGTSSISIL